MRLLHYMNTHPDWQDSLRQSPYNLEIKNDGDYWILKYNMILSNMALPEVQEARGAIFRKEGSEWICVCHPFNKFFNYGEKESAVNRIDWETAVVQQKVDGSLIKVWWDRNTWHVSTNGSIVAYTCECGYTTFGILFSKAIEQIPNFYDALNPDYCYMFELTSPQNHIVVHYEGIQLWYLGCRNMVTGFESNERLELAGLSYPQVFPHHSLADCIEAAHRMGVDEEGYVVCDAHFNRIKIKGDEYLALHKMRGNGPLTVARVIEMWQNDTLDDFMAYFPEHTPFIQQILQVMRNEMERAEIAFRAAVHLTERRDFALNANTYRNPIRAYLFARLDMKVLSAQEFFKQMRARSLANDLVGEITINDNGVIEDV